MAVPDRLLHGMDKWWKVVTLISMDVVQSVTNAIDKVPCCLVSQQHPLSTNVCAFGYERLDRLLGLQHELQCLVSKELQLPCARSLSILACLQMALEKDGKDEETTAGRSVRRLILCNMHRPYCSEYDGTCKRADDDRNLVNNRRLTR